MKNGRHIRGNTSIPEKIFCGMVLKGIPIRIIDNRELIPSAQAIGTPMAMITAKLISNTVRTTSTSPFHCQRGKQLLIWHGSNAPERFFIKPTKVL